MARVVRVCREKGVTPGNFALTELKAQVGGGGLPGGWGRSVPEAVVGRLAQVRLKGACMRAVTPRHHASYPLLSLLLFKFPCRSCWARGSPFLPRGRTWD